MQWDDGAAVLFHPDRGVFNKLTGDMATNAGWPQPPSYELERFVSGKVFFCLQDTIAKGDPPDACLVDEYLGAERGRTRQTYFVYEQRSASSRALHRP